MTAVIKGAVEIRTQLVAAVRPACPVLNSQRYREKPRTPESRNTGQSRARQELFARRAATQSRARAATAHRRKARVAGVNEASATLVKTYAEDQSTTAQSAQQWLR